MVSFIVASLRLCPGEGTLLLQVSGDTVELFGLVVFCRSWMLNLGRPEHSLGENPVYPSTLPFLTTGMGGGCQKAASRL